MIEPPLERLNYYNGQRLEAGDLKLEQEYHIRTRRWLNKSLYTPGIASGLDVRPEKGTRTIIVSPGLALDAEGREILLLEEARLNVPGKPHKKAQGSDATVEGMYLTIRYNEEPIHEERNGCVPQSECGKQNGNRPAWGGPARVQAKPQFNWCDSLPYESSGEVLLAQVELTPDCSQVHQVNTGVRRYVGAASDAKVRQYALEGERTVAYIQIVNEDGSRHGKPIEEKAQIYFHIRGRQPKAVTLYLKALKFSELYYTELGAHKHNVSVEGSTRESNPELNSTHTSHRHDAGTLAAASTASEHNHTLSARKGYIGNGPENTGLAAFFLIERNFGVKLGLPSNTGNPIADAAAFLTNLFGGPFEPTLAPEIDSSVDLDILDDVQGTIAGGGHPHSITGATAHFGPDLKHTHSLSGSGISGSTGVYDPANPSHSARSGAPLTYVDDLRVKIDGNDVTRAIVDQLKAADPIWFANGKDKLGDGTPTHPLADESRPAVPIKLDFLPGVFFNEGVHLIELRTPEIIHGVSVPNGGRILYNLYVE